MIKRARSTGRRQRQWWPTPSIVLSGLALFVVLGGSAVAATGLIQAGDIAAGAVTGKAIRSGAVEPRDLSTSTRALLAGTQGVNGARGDTGAPGTPGSNGADGAKGTTGAEGAKGTNGVNGANGPNGANGANGAEGAKGANGTDGTNGTNGANGANGPNGAAGANGANGAEGAKGANGTDGTNGANGANGANGPNGANGTDGADGKNGTDGVNGTNGSNGTDGADGTITPLSAKQGLTALPTASPPTTVVALMVPAGNYVVLAKTQLSHTGAGDSIVCELKAGATTLDQVAMKTMPALAAVPASLQAVTTITTSPTQLSLQCDVSVANGSADFNSLIAIPTA